MLLKMYGYTINHLSFVPLSEAFKKYITETVHVHSDHVSVYTNMVQY